MIMIVDDIYGNAYVDHAVLSDPIDCSIFRKETSRR